MQNGLELEDRIEITENVRIHELISSRRSTVAFSDKMPSKEEISSLFEAARWAPSSFNEQPWRFILTKKGSEAYDRIFSSLMPGNQSWAGTAPLLVVTVAKTNNSRTGAPNRHALHDLGLAVGNISLQATAMRLKLHQMGGFSVDAIRMAFGISNDYEPVAVVAIGYPGDLQDLKEDLALREQRPRSRKPLEEIVFEGEWSESG